MTNELDQLKRAFKAGEAGRAPEKTARDAAISAAMEAFDEENQADRQGSGLWDRLKDTGNTVFNTFIGRRPMNATSPNLKPYLLGGVSLAVISLAVLNVEHLRLMTPEPTVLGLDFNDLNKEEAGRRNSQPMPSTAPTEGKVVADKNVSDARQRAESEVDAVRSDDKADTDVGAVASEPVARELLPDINTSGNVSAFRSKSKPRAATSPQFQMAQGLAGKKADERMVLQQIAPAPVPGDTIQPRYYRDQGRDKFAKITSNPVKQVKSDPVSTFSIDVDTASYAFMRASLNNGMLPQPNSVRVEEMINYFPYDYELPRDREAPFATHATVMPTPWNTETKLLHVGIKGYDLPKTEKPRTNLVFLIDTSGSMNAPNKLPLLVNSFKLLLNTLSPDDTVSIVTYAGRAGTVLEPTKAGKKAEILASLDRLRSRGSTAGGEGIRQAYQLAQQNYDKDGVNRVILATDGDFNVGITNPEELKGFVERKRKTGISLSVLGFGRGNYNDQLMQTLAQNGNGNAAYIDSLSEARKVLVEEAGSTLFTIAKDVKIQIEFNPAVISEYRLIGYESRMLKREDFNNDKVDAGEIGAGHSVTAIYELTPVGSGARLVDDLRYQSESSESQDQARPAGASNEFGFLKLRYKLPEQSRSKLLEFPITTANEVDSVDRASSEARFASSVAAFGQLLHGGEHTGEFTYDNVISLANSARGKDEFGYRAEFVNLVRLARSAAALQPQ